ncbi:MAG: HAMP domain-containing protein [Thermoleophilia bacterium]|nr:HAMP domain-containing protein [Thermoleophilia bacterium]
MAAVLAGLSFLLVDRLASSLDRTLNQGLHARAADLTALVEQSDTGLREASGTPAGGAASFAQVLDTKGRIVDETRGLGSRPLLGTEQLRRARSAPVLVTRVRRSGGDVRLLAVPVHAQERKLVIVVGAPLRQRDQALAALRRELLVGGPLSLLAVALFGYLVAAAALRPVERLRARASSISERDLSERLPVPRARDELARLGETLNAMLARIERGMKQERAFVADAAHELRTPIALLRAEVDVALDRPRGEPELRAALQSIGEEADRLSQLADDLLLLARLDEGRLPLRLEPVDVRELLTDVAVRFARRATEAERRIEVDADRPLRVLGDRLRLEQALGNLVDNALRHGGGTIRLQALEAAADVEIHVADDGPGFPADFGAVAFERFTRADSSRAGAGAGLGLAIVKAILDAHGGRVTLGGSSAGGAEVCLALRRLDPAGAAETETTRSGPGARRRGR